MACYKTPNYIATSKSNIANYLFIENDVLFSNDSVLLATDLRRCNLATINYFTQSVIDESF